MNEHFKNFSDDALNHPGAPVRDAFINKAKRTLTSAALFLLAYLMAWAIQQYTTSALLLMFDYNPVISFNDNANLPLDYRQWNLARINIICSGGSILCMIIGLAIYFIWDDIPYSVFKMFAIIFSICCINLFLGFLLFSPFGINHVGSNLYKGYAIIGTWWRMGEVVFFIMAVISFIASIIFGFIISDKLLVFSFSSRINRTTGGKNSLIIQFFVLPVLLSFPLVAFLTTPKSFFIHCFLFANLLLIAVGMFLKNEYGSKIILARKEDVVNKIPVVELLIAAAIYALILLFLK